MAWSVSKSNVLQVAGHAELDSAGGTNQTLATIDVSAYGDGTHHAGAHFLVIVSQNQIYTPSPIIYDQTIWSVKLARSTSGWAAPVATKLSWISGGGATQTVSFAMSGNNLLVRANAPESDRSYFTWVRGPIGESLP
jgi:hypothetical protein